MGAFLRRKTFDRIQLQGYPSLSIGNFRITFTRLSDLSLNFGVITLSVVVNVLQLLQQME